jgi:hypothetical protein
MPVAGSGSNGEDLPFDPNNVCPQIDFSLCMADMNVTVPEGEISKPSRVKTRPVATTEYMHFWSPWTECACGRFAFCRLGEL